ncbi:hypothetical protein T492DRAFT_836644 [Pavlovales sp. CCMP2436]|nr:hypothetical protein T492DRAFT_836644 [Pavlovales sp. CCMP2436]
MTLSRVAKWIPSAVSTPHTVTVFGASTCNEINGQLENDKSSKQKEPPHTVTQWAGDRVQQAVSSRQWAAGSEQQAVNRSRQQARTMDVLSATIVSRSACTRSSTALALEAVTGDIWERVTCSLCQRMSSSLCFVAESTATEASAK